MPSLHHYQHSPTRMLCLIQLINLHWQIITTPKSIVYISIHLCALHSVVVQLPIRIQLFASSWTAACQGFLSLTIFQSLSKFMFIVLVMPSRHLILWRPLLLLPSILPSIRDFSNESVHITWPKYGSFNFSSSVPPTSIQGWFPLRLTGLISLLSKRLSGVFSSITVGRHQFFGILPSFWSSSHNGTRPLWRP